MEAPLFGLLRKERDESSDAFLLDRQRKCSRKDSEVFRQGYIESAWSVQIGSSGFTNNRFALVLSRVLPKQA
jgi:hypothetical protein